MSICSVNVYEIITVEIDFNGKNIALSSLYRAPNTSVVQFVEEMDYILGNSNRKTWYLMGDLNIDLLKYDTEHSRIFLDNLYSHSFRPLIHVPTRISKHSETLIDNIFTNEIDCSMYCGTIADDLSDHLPTFAIIDYKSKNKVHSEIRYRRKYDEQSKLNFVTALQNISWDLVYANDVETSYNNFLELFLSLINRHLPFEKSHQLVNL